MTTRADELIAEIETACPQGNRHTLVAMQRWCFEEAIRRLVEFECANDDPGFDVEYDEYEDELETYDPGASYTLEKDEDGMTHRWRTVPGKIMLELSKLADPGRLTVADLTQILGPTADVRNTE
jgi:hypothetical protein